MNPDIWIRACLKIMEGNLEICQELLDKKEITLLVKQAKAFKRHIDSFVIFLEKLPETKEQ